MSFQLKRLRPGEDGARSALYDLEAEIMEVVWRHFSEAFTVRDVFERMERERDLAYTTVMTVVDRLAKKGLLSQERAGKTYIYRALVGRESFMSTVVQQLFQSLPPDFRESALSCVLESAGETDPDELDRLQAMIDARRKALGRE